MENECVQDNLGTLLSGAVALAHAIDNTQDEEANYLLLKALEIVVFRLDVPRGEVIEVDFTPDTDTD